MRDYPVAAGPWCRRRAIYLCFSSGRETTIPENDLKTAKLSYITELIVVTNADIDDDDEDEDAAAR